MAEGESFFSFPHRLYYMEGQLTEDKGTTQWMSISLNLSKYHIKKKIEKQKGFIVMFHSFKH